MYRSLYTFIDFLLLEKSLKEMNHLNVDIMADSGDAKAQKQQLDLDINDYKELFADDFCRNLQTDMQSQVAFIERLSTETEEFPDLDSFVEYCANEYSGLNLFMPKKTGLTFDTYIFNAKELCTVFAQTITELKNDEVDLGVPYMDPEDLADAPSKKVKTPYNVMDYAKALQIVAHELYIEKQRINIRNNCHNKSFMT